jgi:hypothetical protein
MTPPKDEAAIASARADALAEIDQIEKAEKVVGRHRAARDAAIHKMNKAGRSVPDISRDLKLPASTIRQAIKNHIVRSAAGQS